MAVERYSTTPSFTHLSSLAMASCSSEKVTLSSRVKLAVFPSDDVTLILFLAGWLVGLGESPVGRGGVVLAGGGGVNDFCRKENIRMMQAAVSQ